MRTFGETFTTLLASETAETFWTLRLDFGGGVGSLYFSDRGDVTSVGGNDHEPLIVDWGQIAADVDREEKVMNVAATTITFSNFPVMSTGEKISDLLQGVTLETVRGTIFMNIRDPADSSTSGQEALFLGVIQASDANPISYDYRRAQVTLISLSEYYLNQSALRVITESDFPSIRSSDIGATIPIVFGTVPKCPGRVAKAGKKTVPIADPDNVSSARLRDYTVLPAAVAEDWTLVFKASEAAPSQKAYDGEVNVGARSASEPTVDVAGTTTTGSSEQSSLTQSVTLGANARDLLVAVQIDNYSGGTEVLSVTYNGVALTSKGIVTTQDADGTYREVTPVRFYLYRLPFPDVGSAHDLVVTLNKAAPFLMNYISINGGVIGNSYALQVNPGWANYIEASLNTKGLLLGFVDRKDDTGGSIAVYAGQTSRTAGATSFASSSNVRGAISTKSNTTGTSTKVGWTLGSLTRSWLSVKCAEPVPTVYGQSFGVSSAQQLGAVKLKLRVNSTAVPSGGSVYVNLGLFEDDGSGNPSRDPIATSGVVFSSRTFTDVVFGFSGVTLSSSTTYWLVPMCYAGSDGTGNVNWAKNSAGGYAGGNANVGEYGYTNWQTGRWAGGMSGEDFAFELVFVAGGAGYEAFGSVTGYAGAGSTALTFTTDGEAIRIAPENWQGTPVAGDRFTFSVDPSPALVIFSESPSATPISAIDAVWWDDVQILDDTISTLDDDTGDYIAFRPSEFQSVAQAFAVDVGLGIKDIRIVADKVGYPDSSVLLQIVRATGGPLQTLIQGQKLVSTGDGDVPDDSVIAAAQISGSDIASTSDTLTATLSTPVVLEAGYYFLVVSVQGQTDSANYFRVYLGNTVGGTYDDGSPLARFASQNSQITSGVYTDAWVDMDSAVDNPSDLAFQLTAITVTKNLSADDGTGNYVASVNLDVDIPDTASIDGSITGIKDDSSGTYAGSASSLLLRPDAIAHWLLNWWDVPDDEIDLGGSFASSAELYGTLYRIEGSAQDDWTRKKLLLTIAFESRAALSWFSGIARWSYLKREVIDADVTVAKADIIPEGLNPIVTVRKSPTAKIVNFIDLRYERWPSRARGLTAYQRIYNAQNEDSINGLLPDGSDAFGKRENPEKFFCDFVRYEEMAADLAAFYADRLGFPRRIVEVTSTRTLLALEEDDSVSFDLR